jgi:hypothetical protein
VVVVVVVVVGNTDVDSVSRSSLFFSCGCPYFGPVWLPVASF